MRTSTPEVLTELLTPDVYYRRITYGQEILLDPHRIYFDHAASAHIYDGTLI